MAFGTIGQLLIFCGSLCKAKDSTGLGREGQREKGGREREGRKEEGEKGEERKEHRKEDLSSTHSRNNRLLSQILFVVFVLKS